jgi:hypothetical protein
VSGLLDSTTALAVLAGDSTFASAFELLAIGFDAGGSLRQVRVLEANLPAATARRLAILIAGLIDQQPAGAPGQFRLTVDLSSPPGLSVSRSEICRLSLRPGQIATGTEDSEAQVAGTSNRWIVSVDAGGHAVTAIPLTGIAPVLAASAHAAVVRLAFNPALLDRVPVAMTDTVTIGSP